MSNEPKEKDKLTLKERLKDKKEKAKIELAVYGIFFVIVIIFVRVSSNNNYVDNTPDNNFESFILEVEDNYEYDTLVTINEDTYHYYGKVLGNNSTINLIEEDVTYSYYLNNNKYYVLEDNNYVLTDKKTIYPYIDERYLNVTVIKEYLSIAENKDNSYTVKVSDLLLNNESNEEISIYIEEGDKNIIIDYTNLFKQTQKDINKLVVNITYSNIDKVITLE